MAGGKQVRGQSLTLWPLRVLPVTSPCSLALPGSRSTIPNLCWGRVLLSFQPLTPRQGAGVTPHRETLRRVMRHAGGGAETSTPHPLLLLFHYLCSCHSCQDLPALHWLPPTHLQPFTPRLRSGADTGNQHVQSILLPKTL